MIVRVAAFNWAPATTPEDVEAHLAALRSIPGDVEGVRELLCGRNEATNGQGLAYAIYARFDDQEALAAYQEHPAHVAAAGAMDLDQTRSADHQPGLVVDLLG